MNGLRRIWTILRICVISHSVRFRRKKAISNHVGAFHQAFESRTSGCNEGLPRLDRLLGTKVGLVPGTETTLGDTGNKEI